MGYKPTWLLVEELIVCGIIIHYQLILHELIDHSLIFHQSLKILKPRKPSSHLRA